MKQRHWSAILLFLLALSVFLYSAYHLWGYASATRASRQAVDELANQAVQPAGVLDAWNEKGQAEMPSIQVDFAALQARNPDIIGWLYAERTLINYPVLQGDDNDQYLRRLPDGNYNIAGSLFLDSRNRDDFSDGNSVIYGHNMKNKTMFGALPQYLDQAYFDEHRCLYLFTPQQIYRVELIAAYLTRADSAAYTIPQTQEELADFEKTARENSAVSAPEQESAPGRVLTLSTCAYDFEDARCVLVGVLQPLT